MPDAVQHLISRCQVFRTHVKQGYWVCLNKAALSGNICTFCRNSRDFYFFQLWSTNLLVSTVSPASNTQPVFFKIKNVKCHITFQLQTLKNVGELTTFTFWVRSLISAGSGDRGSGCGELFSSANVTLNLVRWTDLCTSLKCDLLLSWNLLLTCRRPEPFWTAVRHPALCPDNVPGCVCRSPILCHTCLSALSGAHPRVPNVGKLTLSVG